MKYYQKKHFVTILFALFIFICPPPVFSQEINLVTTEIIHEPIEYFLPNNRILIETEIIDETGIKLVRCYFRADAADEFVFVPMKRLEENEYRAILPAPAGYSETIEYLFLALNTSNQVVKTQTFKVSKDDKKGVPEWQKSRQEGNIAIYTELSEAPETVAGFSDSMSVDVVESGARFGMVAGIYSTSAVASSGGATGAAAAASSAGTVAAGAGGVSTAVVVATGAGIAAAGAGVAVAADSDDSDGTKTNTVASISWGDNDAIPDDAFRILLDNDDYGETSQVITKTNLPVGDYALTITCTSLAGSEGNYTITLGGGAIFTDDNSTRKEGTLALDQSHAYQIHIPNLADTTISW